MKGHSRLLLSAIMIIGVALSLTPRPDLHAQGAAKRMVLAFYYPWFDRKTWTSGQVPDVPLTPYNSDDRAAIARQIEQAQGAGIDAFVVNWWGKGNRTEKNLKSMLDIAANKGFRVTVDFDLNSPFMGGVGSYAENLRHLHSVHAAHPAYLRYQGRPVVFFYNVSRLGVNTWSSLRDQVDPNRTALWIAEGTALKYQTVFDGHHLYSITWPNRIPPSSTLPKWGDRVRKYNREHGTAKLWIATVMPGYDDRRIRPQRGFAHSRDGGEYYRHCWEAAVASKPQWVIINSFNEWPEGTYIEPSRTYGTLFLDLTREWASRFKGVEHSPDPAPPTPPTPTPIPLTPMPAISSASALPAPSPSMFAHDTSKYLQEDEWMLLPDTLCLGCGFVRFEIGIERFWTVYRDSDITSEEAVLMVY